VPPLPAQYSLGKRIVLSRRVGITLTLLLFLLVNPASPVTAVLGIHGTLVVIVPNRDGLLICADRQSYDPMRGDVDII
jgi:hypothetical protein